MGYKKWLLKKMKRIKNSAQINLNWVILAQNQNINLAERGPNDIKTRKTCK